MNVCKSVESQALAQIWSQASASGKNMYLRDMLRDNVNKKMNYIRFRIQVNSNSNEM